MPFSIEFAIFIVFTVFTDASSATDTAGISKHRLSPYIAYYRIASHNYTAPDSSAGERCFLKVLQQFYNEYNLHIASSSYQ